MSQMGFSLGIEALLFTHSPSLSNDVLEGGLFSMTSDKRFKPILLTLKIWKEENQDKQCKEN